MVSEKLVFSIFFSFFMIVPFWFAHSDSKKEIGDSKKALVILMEECFSPQFEIRYNAIEKIRQMGTSGADALPAIRLLLQNSRSDIRIKLSALGALEGLGKRAAQALPELLSILQDQTLDSSLHFRAILILAHLEGDVQDAAVLLIKYALDSGKFFISLNQAALFALEKLAPYNMEKAIPELLKYLGEEDLNQVNKLLQIFKALGKYAVPAIPELIKALGHPSKTVQINSLKIIASFEHEARSALPAIVNFFQTEQRDLPSEIVVRLLFAGDAYDRLTRLKNSDDIQAFYKILTLLNIEVQSRQGSSCVALCQLVEEKTRRSWLGENYFKPEVKMPKSAWSVALLSLSHYFFLKASPYCKELKNFPTMTAASLLDNDLEVTSSIEKTGTSASISTLSDLEFLLQTLNESVQTLFQFEFYPWSGVHIYASSFYHLIFRELSRLGFKISPEQIKSSERLLSLNLALKADYGNGDSNEGSTNSGFNTYALATAILATSTPSERGVEMLKTMVKRAASPLQLPYLPLEDGDSSVSRRASAARNVPVHLALFLSEKSREQRKNNFKNLFDSVENYNQYMLDLMVHVPRNFTHLGEDSLAPYYFYSSIPYVTAALRLLEEQSDILMDSKMNEKISDLRRKIEMKLLFFLKKDGKFQAQGESFYFASDGYVNPLAGLALLPLLNGECNGVSAKSHGILDEQKILF